MSFEFLSLEDVLAIHAQQLNRFGGASGLRDQGLLESALAQPQASFGGQIRKSRNCETLRKPLDV